MAFEAYDPENFYDELFSAMGKPRSHCVSLVDHMIELGIKQLEQQRQTAEIALFKLGVTFNVYSDNRGIEKIFPFDIIPRIIDGAEWSKLAQGLKQRIQALNLFLEDIYGEQKIIKDGKIPSEIIYTASGFLKPCLGIKAPAGVWCHITGTDLVRDRDGGWYVLEDNFMLLDVRNPNEYEIAKIEGSVLIPLSELEDGQGVEKVKELLNGHRLIAHCKLGGRSAKALNILKEAGIEGTNVKGGIIAWSQEIDSSIPQY